MDIINKDGYGQDNYFSKEKMEKLQDISMQSSVINREMSKQYKELMNSNICQYVNLVVEKHLDFGLKAVVVMIEPGMLPQKKKDAIISQLRRLSLQVTTRLLIAFDDGVLDCLYQPNTPKKEDLN